MYCTHTHTSTRVVLTLTNTRASTMACFGDFRDERRLRRSFSAGSFSDLSSCELEDEDDDTFFEQIELPPAPLKPHWFGEHKKNGEQNSTTALPRTQSACLSCASLEASTACSPPRCHDCDVTRRPRRAHRWLYTMLAASTRSELTTMQPVFESSTLVTES